MVLWDVVSHFLMIPYTDQIFQVRNGAVRTMSIPEHQETDKDYGKGSDRMCIMQALATSAVFFYLTYLVPSYFSHTIGLTAPVPSKP